ncbi:MAG: hypothetical protein ACU85V_02780 [Gammaproteobacteria bacterium]
MSSDAAAPPRRMTVAVSRRGVPPALGALVRHLANDPALELRLLFIEDSDLLKAAALPFLFECCTLTNLRRPLDPAAMEVRLRREAAAAREDFARLLAASACRWHFEVRRARKPSVFGDYGEDTLFVPDTGVTEAPPQSSGAVAALVDDSSAGARALEAARRIAGGEGLRLETFVVRDGAQSDAGADAVRVISPQQVGGIVARRGPILTVVTAALLEGVVHGLDELCDRARAPVLLLR